MKKINWGPPGLDLTAVNQGFYVALVSFSSSFLIYLLTPLMLVEQANEPLSSTCHLNLKIARVYRQVSKVLQFFDIHMIIIWYTFNTIIMQSWICYPIINPIIFIIHSIHAVYILQNITFNNNIHIGSH